MSSAFVFAVIALEDNAWSCHHFLILFLVVVHDGTHWLRNRSQEVVEDVVQRVNVDCLLANNI